MGITRQQALDAFESDDLIGLGMEANAVRRRLHPEGVVTYIIDRNINYTNFCTEYCTFCAFYRPLKGKLAAEGYILDFDTIYDNMQLITSLYIASAVLCASVSLAAPTFDHDEKRSVNSTGVLNELEVRATPPAIQAVPAASQYFPSSFAHLTKLCY